MKTALHVARVGALALSLLASTTGSLSAATVLWSGAAGDDLWSNPLNWIGGSVPMAGDDVEFGPNPGYQALANYSVQLGAITYTPSATLTYVHAGAGTASTLTLSGAGIVNNTPASNVNPQYFYADAGTGPVGGTLLFANSATIGGSNTTTLTASRATFSGGGSGSIVFQDTSSAAGANLFAQGTNVAGAAGGRVVFQGNATAGAASVAATTGFNGGQGGRIVFLDNADGGTAHIGLDGDGTAGSANGTLDISGSARASVTIGSVEGTAGLVNLGNRNLAVGGNNENTSFGGVIQGTTGGSLTKEGSGFLSLGGNSTYTGATTVSSGALLVSNGSLASSHVTVNAGATLGGNGTLAGLVDLAAGANLTPSYLGGGTTLTVGALTSVAGTNFNYKLGAPGVIGGPSNDLVNVTGNLTLAGTLNITDSGGFGLGAYRLMNYGGMLTYNGLSLGMLPAGYAASDFAVQTGAGQVNLIVGGTNVQFWDGAQTAGNGVVNGGTGTWNNATTNWTDAGGVANAAWGSHFSVFGGTAGTVTVAEPVTSTGMQFSTSGYTVNANPGGSVVLAGAATIRVDSGLSATINAPLTGSGSLTKLDTGTLTLSGNSSYTGGTTIADGQVIVTNAAGLGLGTGPVTVLAASYSELTFVGNASAGGVTITNAGAPSINVSGLTQFHDTATAGTATFRNAGNTASGGLGGQLDFLNGSTAGSATITNVGSAFAPPTGIYANYGAGTTLFANNATAGNAGILNTAGLASGTQGGRVLFADSASAGASTITNQGSFAYGDGGLAEFLGNATAGTATFSNQAATIALGSGGTVNFRDNSSAGGATFTQAGSGVAGAGTSTAGGAVTFYDSSSAGVATFLNQGAAAASTYGGATIFRDTSTAGTARIVNASGVANSGVGGGHLIFSDNSSAGNATITSQGGSAATPDAGTVSFIASATAGSATLTASGGTGGGGAGTISFAQTSTGGTARIVLDGGTLDISGLSTTGTTVGSLEGDGGNVYLGNKGLTVGGNNLSTVFGGTISGGGTLTKTSTGSLTLTSASTYSGGTVISDGALIVTNAAGLALGTGPVTNNPTVASDLNFTGSASAGHVTISNLGSNSTAYSLASFDGNATAGTANVTNRASTGTGGSGGKSVFSDAATAGSATILNAGGAFSLLSGNGAAATTNFNLYSNAGNATIINASALNSVGLAGETFFNMSTSAAASTITNQGGAVAGIFGGETVFLDHSTAGNSTVVAAGGVVSGAYGGLTYFAGNSTAGSATVYADAALGGATGGQVIFQDSASGGTARAIIQGATFLSPGELNIASLNTSGMNIGSIEGGGIVTLGSHQLVVGGNGASTTFSGLIRDAASGPATGGSLAVSGAGASLRLTGANTYTGGTRIGDGVNMQSGKLIAANSVGSATGSGAVVVDFGGTLSGNGHIAGPVTLRSGGLIAPGDPSDLTLENDLTWDGGGVIQLVLGDDQADSDLVTILGHLVRGVGSDFRFDLIDAGFSPNQTYELLSAGGFDGFSASDFSVTGIAGALVFQNGVLDFIAASAPLTVPEPGTVWLMLAGTLLMMCSTRRLRPAAR